MKQAFFDGPFTYGGEDEGSEQNPLSLGFQRLIEFDDREAERYFREALQFPDIAPAALLGLAQVNSDDQRRATCFLEEALPLLEENHSDLLGWYSLLNHSLFKSGATSTSSLGEWKEVALQSDTHYPALSLARHVVLSSLDGESIENGREFLKDLTVAAPSLARLPLLSDQSLDLSEAQWLRLLAEEQLLSGNTEEGINSLLGSLESELRRLEETGLLMPQGSLNLGDSADRLLRLLEMHHSEEAKSIALSLLKLPRDPFSVGKRWRRLERESTPWVVGRTALARMAFRDKDWDSLAQLPRGFSSQDKSEWFLWQTIAAAETDANINLWLAALRRERDGKDLLAGAENYLHWKQEGEWLEEIPLPGVALSGDIIGSADGAASSIQVSLPEKFLSSVKLPAPGFSLPDWQGQNVQMEDYEGGPLLIIFFLGGGCLHCVEQLTAFGPWAGRYEEAGIPILAISTDPVEILSETISGDTAPEGAFPIPIVSDADLVTFQEWGVYDAFDDRAIHATFLLNEDKEIIWMEKGNAPYMHPDFLLHEAQRLLSHE